MRMKISVAAILALFFAVLVYIVPAADTLPAQLTDAEYWQMISDFSEPNGYFQYEIVTSNEISYQSVLPDLMKTPRAGGAYLGVGPEQNFTYIAAIQPKIAFIIDIRRDMMLEHLMYKAVFEMSSDRVEFLSNLFSRKRPSQLTDSASVRAMFQAYAAVPADRMLAEDHLKEIMTRLKAGHHFPLTSEDESRIRMMYLDFLREGVITFDSSFMSPGYAALMTAADNQGMNWSYLASRESYDRVRALHQKNLIIPLVGDFAGPKAIRTVGQYLKDHGTVVKVFYISNVEDYIRAWPAYEGNIATLPIDSSSEFIRWSPSLYTSLARIVDFLRPDRR